MYNPLDLTGRKIVVIGASSGIGRQIAVTLSRLGAVLTLVARRADKLDETLAELEGAGHCCIAADVSEPEAVEALFRQIQTEVGAIDGLVYSAGVNLTLPLMQLKAEKLHRIFAVNLDGFVESVRQATRRGRFQPGMRIVAVSSNAALRGEKGHTAYSASKAAMNAAVRCMAKELADKDICVNAVAPAMTATEMLLEYEAKEGGMNSAHEALKSRQYLGLVQPEDVAAAVAFLISPAARAVTGITMPVDCGLSTS